MIYKSTMSKSILSVLIIISLVFSFNIYTNTDSTYAAGLKVKSSGIKNGIIDEKYGMYGAVEDYIPTCSIPLKITKSPKKTKYYAVYMYDPDADNFVHWIAVNYKSKTFKANASITKKKKMKQGINDFGKNGYGGPYPPVTHTYKIKVYALDSKVALKNGFTYKEFKKAIKGKVLASKTLTGKYIVK